MVLRVNLDPTLPRSCRFLSPNPAGPPAWGECYALRQPFDWLVDRRYNEWFVRSDAASFYCECTPADLGSLPQAVFGAAFDAASQRNFATTSLISS
jgi:hypothetical protein